LDGGREELYIFCNEREDEKEEENIMGFTVISTARNIALL